MIARKAVQWEPKNTSIGLAPSRVKWREHAHSIRLFLSQGSVLLFMLFAVLFGMYAYVSQTARIDSYKLVRAQQELHELQKTNAQLQVDIAERKSPARIQKIAQTELGMVLPSQFIFSTKNTKVEKDQAD